MDRINTERKTIFEEGQVLLFDKPLYWTSFDLVNKVRIMIRSITGVKNLKAGHAGTLDPLASGLMIICTGKATKSIEQFRDLDKEYVASIHIGKTTPSYDLETETDMSYPTEHLTEELILRTLEKFRGEQKQVPPMHSAKMIKGKRAYEYARKGIDKKLEPVSVFFREIELLSCSIPEIKVNLVCSKGTYIRSFARDLGTALGSGAFLSGLERKAIGPWRLENAMNLKNFEIFLDDLKQNGKLYV